MGLSTIGELAKTAGLPVSTIRYYTDIGLLKVTAKTTSGYRLYNEQVSLRIIHLIKPSSERRRSLVEIKNSLYKKLFDKNTPKIHAIKEQPIQNFEEGKKNGKNRN